MLRLKLAQCLIIVADRFEVVGEERNNIATRVSLAERVEVLQDVHRIDGTLLKGRCYEGGVGLEILLDSLHLAVDSLDSYLVALRVVDAVIIVALGDEIVELRLLTSSFSDISSFSSDFCFSFFNAFLSLTLSLSKR